jgi:hypothetical protein
MDEDSCVFFVDSDVDDGGDNNTKVEKDVSACVPVSESQTRSWARYFWRWRGLRGLAEQSLSRTKVGKQLTRTNKRTCRVDRSNGGGEALV